jgi:putative effector of murein hydrolase
VPELTAVFVMFTGVFGAMLGGVLLKWLPLRSAWRAARCLALAPTVPASAGRMKWAAKKARWPGW